MLSSIFFFFQNHAGNFAVLARGELHEDDPLIEHGFIAAGALAARVIVFDEREGLQRTIRSEPLCKPFSNLGVER